MYIDDLNNPQSRQRLNTEIGRLQKLIEDLKALAAGYPPSADVLQKAPLLQDYRPVFRPTPSLSGRVTGHPEIAGAATPMVTSTLCVLLAEKNAARTLSRWYRLGNSAQGRSSASFSPSVRSATPIGEL